jgi:hypothetical protein
VREEQSRRGGAPCSCCTRRAAPHHCPRRCESGGGRAAEATACRSSATDACSADSTRCHLLRARNSAFVLHAQSRCDQQRIAGDGARVN